LPAGRHANALSTPVAHRIPQHPVAQQGGPRKPRTSSSGSIGPNRWDCTDPCMTAVASARASLCGWPPKGPGWWEEIPGGAMGARTDALCTGAELSNPKRAHQQRGLTWPWGFRHHNQWHDKESDAQGSTRQPAAIPSPLLCHATTGPRPGPPGDPETPGPSGREHNRDRSPWTQLAVLAVSSPSEM
jgi:hypothetical protein